MDDNDMKILIEKYFDGLTSLKEEQKLRDYFQREDVSQEWEIYKPIFRYFTSERETVSEAESINNCVELQLKPAIPRYGLLRWGSVAAAACLLLITGLSLFLNTGGRLSETSLAYIDGEKYTDMELIRTEALKSLENLSEGSDNVYSSQIEALEIFIK
jgi:hypothetical protein